MTEIIFEVTEDEVGGGYSASALGHGIHTQGDSVEEIRSNAKEAVDCYFDDTMPRPKLIRLHFAKGRGARGVRLPRNVSGASLQAALRRLGYTTVRQRGSHVRMPTQINGEHHEVIPLHPAIKVKTPSSTLKSVARHHEVGVEELLKKLDL